MNITITARKFELGDSLREKVEKKLKKLDKYFANESKANVTITRERDRETVELTIYQGSLIFRAQSTTKDMMESLAEDIDIVERQIRKNKTRLEKKLRSGFDKTEIDVAPAEPVEEEGEFNVVKVKKFPLKPMTTEEAILQMNMLNHNFFTFKSISGVYSIVYRRKDGNYAVIEAVE